VPVEALAGAQAFYPLVGLLLGGMLVGLDWALREALPPGVVAAMLVVALAAATRALHLDGLADTFDGLLGGHARERRLAIMHDPRVGSFGATALALVLLLKWSAIAGLSGAERWPALLLAPMLARSAMVVTAAAFPYARPEGLGTGYRRAARGPALVVALGSAAAVSVLVLGPGGGALLGVTTLVALGTGVWALRLVGGVTGDIYGAVCELAETLALLVALGLAERGLLAPWPVRP
jgi:adenosylcobinamide-GDP ribazoletransferase